MKKRLLALALCLVMLIGLIPAALAGDGDPTVDTPAETTYKRTIHFDANGGVLAAGTEDIVVSFEDADKTTTLQANQKELPADPTRAGYTFGGWFATRNEETGELQHPFTETAEIPNNRTVKNVYAKWIQNQYTLRLKSGILGEKDKDYVVTTVPGGEDFTLPAYATVKAEKEWAKDADKFLYWTDSTNTFIFPDKGIVNKVSSDITLTAVYKDEAPTLYKVNYFDASAKMSMEAFVESGDKITLNLGAGESAKIDSTVIRGAGTYTVTGNCDLEKAVRGNVTSVGWEYKTETMTFTPVWSEYNVYFYCYYHGKDETIQVPYNTKIVLDTNGGTYNGSANPSAIYVTRDTAIVEAKRTGYFFYGWYVTENSQGTLTFTAMWTRNTSSTYDVYYYDYTDSKYEYYRFTAGTYLVFDPNGGTAKLNNTSFSSQKGFYIYNDYSLSDAVRTGYTFYGWYLTKSGSTYTFTAMWSKSASDVPYMLNGEDHYAYIKGYPNGSFKPNATITRAETAAIFYRLLTDTTRKAYTTTYNAFKDVPAKAWYNTAVSTMAKLGIVTGDANGYFRPSDPITRAEIAAMIARCDGSYYGSSYTNFSDVKGHWAASYIARAYELGWINGYGTTYAPDKYITRAETVAILNRVLNRAPQNTSDLLSGRNTFSDVGAASWYYLDVEEAANSHTYTRKSSGYEYWNRLIADPSWL